MNLLEGFFMGKPTTSNTVPEASEPSVITAHPKINESFEPVKPTDSFELSWSQPGIDEKNPFSDLKVLEYYRDIYESCHYECRSAFDPDLQWSAAEEKKLIRKLDYRVCAFACFAYFALQIDRGNLSQALSDGLLNDLGLTTNDLNTGQLNTSPPIRWITTLAIE